MMSCIDCTDYDFSECNNTEYDFSKYNNTREYQYENVIKALENPKEIIVNSDGMMTCVVKRNGKNCMPDFESNLIVKRLYNPIEITGSHSIVIIAPPVLMALCLGRYESVEGVLEEFDEISFYGELLTTNQKCYNVNIGEYIFFDNNIPDRIKLLIWRLMLLKKREIAKNNKGQVNYIHFCYRYCKKEYSDEFFRTIKMMYINKAKYIKNMVFTREFRELLADFHLKSQCEIWLYVIENIAKSENQLYRLLKNIVLDGYDEFNNAREIYDTIIYFFRKTQKYYNNTEKLRRVFFYALIRTYYGLRRKFFRGSNKLFCEFFENGMKLLIKKYTPKECSFIEYVRLVINSMDVFDYDVDEFFMYDVMSECDYILQLYKMSYDRDIVIDSSLILRQDIYGNSRCRIIDSEKVMINIPGRFMNYYPMIGQYCFDDSLPLNEIQLSVLYTNEEILIREMKKGIIRGKHIKEAVERCYINNTHYLIPCIMASINEPVMNNKAIQEQGGSVNNDG